MAWNEAEAEAEFMRAMNAYLIAFIAAHPPVELPKVPKFRKPAKRSSKKATR